MFKNARLFVMTALAACHSTNIPTQHVYAAGTFADRPNIVVFYVDDLGYGDVGAYGAKGVATPHIDSLAVQGLRFTDAHSVAATCTPSRYALLTGEHGFRIEADILEGNAPLMIRPDTSTLADLMRNAGYRTGVVGKWHLGLGAGALDWNGRIAPGPLELGFDYSFLLPATGDRVPAVYVENHDVVNLDTSDPIEISYVDKVGNRPTGYGNPELLRLRADPQHSDTIINGVSRIGHMAGGESALWTDEDFPDIFTEKAIQFMRSSRDQPFFLFHSFHDIHVPRLPHPRFAGKSTLGSRGDAIVQTDWMVGAILAELERLGIEENTLVIFTSDNGPVLDDGYADEAVELLGTHRPSGPYRGGKYSAYEAGTRVPTIVRWPKRIDPGTSDALLSQIDLYASLASLLNIELENSEAPDSRDHLDAWLGRSELGRSTLVLESVGPLSLRQGNWKYIMPFPPDSRLDWVMTDKNIEGGFEAQPQLYDLANDHREIHNVANRFAERAAAMHALLQQIIDDSYRR